MRSESSPIEFEPEFYEDLDLYRWMNDPGAGHL